MADEHRRVESNNAIAGSGMTADPEKIAQLQSESARMERAYRGPPKRSFDEVLEDPESTLASPEGEPESQSDEADDASEADDARPRVAPDPRMRALHARFGAKKAKK